MADDVMLWGDVVMLWLVGWGLCAVFFALMWLVEWKREDASLVDATWALSLGMLALLYGAEAEGWWPRRAALVAMVGAWSLRLAVHIVRRHNRSAREDPRYREIRESRAGGAHGFFFVFYQAQALLAVVLSVPFLLQAFDSAAGFHGVELFGWGLAAASLLLEWVADTQLGGHLADPGNRGKTCRRGLWRYTRHPNYFFEWLLWCGFAVAVLQAPWGFLGLVSPIVMFYLIVYVTGIPPAEARALKSRGDDYREYQATTSPFVPWFPKKEAT